MPVVLITNCDAEPGLGLAVALAEGGHEVFATMPNIALCGAVEAAATAAGASMEVGPLVLTDDWSLDACISHVVAATGGIDVVVDTVPPVGDGNALADVDALMAATLIGPLKLLRAVLP